MTAAPTLRPARPADLPQVLALLRSAELPTAGVAEGFAVGYAVAEVAEDGGSRLVGAVGVEAYDRVGLLRSAVVHPERRGDGLGALLIRDRLAWARAQGLEALYLLTTTAEAWFPRFGFTPVARAELPEALGASAELRGACPDTARAFRLVLAQTRDEEPPGATPRR